MYRIQNLTTNAKQKQVLVLPDGSQILFTLHFSALQLCWICPTIQYRDWILNGLKITSNANMLYQYRNEIPFGLACFTESSREPTFIEDFATGASRLYILTTDEVEFYTEVLSGQIQS